MKKIIILSRVSTAQQSLESQTKELIANALRLGYSEQNQIIIEDIESAIKLSEEERHGLKRMKDYIENDSDIDCVICWEPSRLSRQQKTLYSIRDYLVDRKIQLYILNPFMRLLTDDRTQIDSTANIVFSLFSTLSENEMMIKKERFMRAKNELTRQGKKSAGSVIFGYMKDKDKNCILHPTDSKIIIDLFNHYIEDNNASLYETYQYAMSRYPEKFKILPYIKAQHKIRHFFDTDIYYKGNWCYPSIITEEMWMKTRKKMSEARCKPRYQCKRQLLSRGMLYCKTCGKMMTPSGGNTKAYICPTDKEHRLQINFDIMDWLIWEETKNIVNLNAALDNDTKTDELKERMKMKENEIGQLEKEIKKIEERQEKILDLYVEGNINKDMLDKRLENMNMDKAIDEGKKDKAIAEMNELRTILEDTQKDLLNIKSINIDSITTFENRLEYIRKHISKAIISKDDKFTMIEFIYKGHPITIQNGIYRYRNIGGTKHIWRINQDGTEDLIYRQRKC